jgi:hypothetical protein
MYDIDKLILQEYSGQNGYGSLPYFAGKQYGSGWLRNVARMAFPFLRKALGVVGNIAVNTAGDLITDENKTIGQTLLDHTVNETRNAFNRNASTSSSTAAAAAARGRGLKRLASSLRSINGSRGGKIRKLII